MGQPSFPADLRYELERIRADISELFRRQRPRRQINFRDLQDVNGHGALNGYQAFYDTATGRYKMAIPPAMVTFNVQGTLSVGSTGHFPIPAPCKLFLTAGRLKTAGSSQSTAIVKKNASTTVATFTFAASANAPSTLTPASGILAVSCVKDDYIWLDTTQAGTSAADLVIPVWAMADVAPV